MPLFGLRDIDIDIDIDTPPGLEHKRFQNCDHSCRFLGSGTVLSKSGFLTYFHPKFSPETLKIGALQKTTIPVKNAEFNMDIWHIYMNFHINMPDVPIKF